MIYKRGSVSVDEAFARFGNRSVAINKITATEVRNRATPGARSFYLLFPIAALWTMVLIGLFSVPAGHGKIAVIITNAIVVA